MSKIEGRVLKGAFPVDNVRVLLMKDFEGVPTHIAETYTNSNGEYKFSHKYMLTTDYYHLVCNFIDQSDSKFNTLSLPYINPIESTDGDNFLFYRPQISLLKYDMFVQSNILHGEFENLSRVDIYTIIDDVITGGDSGLDSRVVDHILNVSSIPY